MEKKPVFRILCGIPSLNIKKYRKCLIGFEVHSSHSFKAKKLGFYLISNFIKFSTKIEFNQRNINYLQVKIILKYKDTLIGSQIIEKSDLKDNKFFLNSIRIKDFEFLLFCAYSDQFLLNRPLKISILSDRSEIRQFDLKENMLKLIWNGKDRFVAKFEEKDKIYVLKAVNTGFLLDFKGSFVRELTLFLLVNHPKIIKMIGYSFLRNYFGFVLEFAEKESLQKFKDKISFTKVMTAICSSMSYMHSLGIIHRDLKPGNVLIDSNLEIKLADFGTSRPIDDEMSKDVGTVGFAAPESNSMIYDYSADVYSAGALACYVIDREKFKFILDSITMKKHIKSLPYQTQVILRAILSKDPAKRPTFIEIFLLLLMKHMFILNDDQSHSYSEAFYQHYETGNDYKYYKNSKSTIGLFHCLMVHCMYKDSHKIGELSHLGQLLGDEYMSYLFDYSVLFSNFIAFDIELRKKAKLFEQYMSLNVDDYRFYLMIPLKLKCRKFEWDQKSMNDYDLGIINKSKNPELALYYFKRAYKAGNIDAGYQIGRIYSLLKDDRCFKYLNDLALIGHKKSWYYLAAYFSGARIQKHSHVSNYFLLLSDSLLHKYASVANVKIKGKNFINGKRELKVYLGLMNYTSVMDKYGTDLFKLCLMHSNAWSYMGAFYLNVLKDEEMANYYLKMCDDTMSYINRLKFTKGNERIEIERIIKQRADQGDSKALKYLLPNDILKNGLRETPEILKMLVTSDEFCHNPDIQHMKGLDSLSRLNYAEAIYYIEVAASQNFLHAIFMKYLLIFHGHCYVKEREKSLEQLIIIAHKLKGIYAYA